MSVEVVLNGLEPADLRVECVVRRVLGSELAVHVPAYVENRRPFDGITYIDGEPVLLVAFAPSTEAGAGAHRYRLVFRPPWTGQLVYELRVVPQHPHLTHPYELGLMLRI